MPADVLIVVVFILVFGCAAFLFGLLYMIYRLISGVGRSMIQTLRPTRKANLDGPLTATSKQRVCPRQRCRKPEYRGEARFCSQCGAPLMDVPEGRRR